VAISRLSKDRDAYRLKLLEDRSRVECPKTVLRAQWLGWMLNVRFDEDFLMRASAQLLFFARLWPALENLSGRKPRGLGGIYGERALWGGFEAAADALFF